MTQRLVGRVVLGKTALSCTILGREGPRLQSTFGLEYCGLTWP